MCTWRKIPSTAAKSIKRSANESINPFQSPVCFFFLIAGKKSALNNSSFSASSSRKYQLITSTFHMNVFHHDLKAIKKTLPQHIVPHKILCQIFALTHPKQQNANMCFTK
jgi:hypothetical protein